MCLVYKRIQNLFLLRGVSIKLFLGAMYITIVRMSWVVLVFICITACQDTRTTAQQAIPDHGISIQYIAHACFIINDGTEKIMIDPYASRVWLGYDFPKNIKVDAIFITHPHYDHDGGMFRGMRPYWMCSIPFYENPATYEIGEFTVQGLIGRHSDPYGMEFGQMNTIWKIKVHGITLAHWGDNGPMTDKMIRELTDVDILFIPMDGDFHIVPKEVYEHLFTIIEPRIIVPMHYRLPDLERDAESPKNLGEIEPFLKQRPKVVRGDSLSYLPEVVELTSNQLVLTADGLPDSTTYYVFQHDPSIRRPDK